MTVHYISESVVAMSITFTKIHIKQVDILVLKDQMLQYYTI